MRRIPREALTSPAIPLVAAHDAKRVEVLLSSAVHPGAFPEQELLQTAQRAVSAIVAGELAQKPEHILAIVSELVREVRHARRLVVSVHPDDVSLLPSATELAEHTECLGSIEVVADASLARGDCVLRSDRGDLDGRIATKLELLAQQLAQQLGTGTHR